MRQFALHLARTVEQTTDVDGMLSRMTPTQFDEWLAFYRIRPWGDDWLQVGTIASAIHNDLFLIASGFGGGKVDEKDLNKPEDYIPKVRKELPQEKNKTSNMKQALVWLRMQTGV